MKPKWTCRLGLHSWTRWEFDTELIITHYPYGLVSDSLKGVSREAVRQKRHCEHCGKLQHHTT